MSVSELNTDHHAEGLSWQGSQWIMGGLRCLQMAGSFAGGALQRFAIGWSAALLADLGENRARCLQKGSLSLIEQGSQATA